MDTLTDALDVEICEEVVYTLKQTTPKNAGRASMVNGRPMAMPSGKKALQELGIDSTDTGLAPPAMDVELEGLGQIGNDSQSP